LKKPVANMAASVRQRLLNIARERKEDFNLVLTKYGLERVLYRISQSQYREIFVLKGALLFELWTKERYRPTRDADFLARGENSPERFVQIFKDIFETKVEDDGVRFDPATVTAERITEDVDYQGIRVRSRGYLENARIPIQVDLGFGDVITPAPVQTEIPSLLNLPTPKLKAYPRESVVSEKFEAMVSLGLTNSRMKDFYDLYKLSQDFSFDGSALSQAIKKTFAARKTGLPTKLPVVFTSEFFYDADKKKQWGAFCTKNRSYVGELSLEAVCKELAKFLRPVVSALVNVGDIPKKWSKGDWIS
jgi:predicted nucleotidyltransferase component of viral defense system